MHLPGNPPRTVSIRHQRNKRCVTIPQMPHKRHAHNNRSGQPTRTSRAISYLWRNTTLLPMRYARCPRHIAHATYDTCDKQKRQRQHFADDEHPSRHTCAQQRCERTCVSCSKLATRGTQMDARNSKRRHERCWRAPQHDGFLERGSLRQPSPKRLRRNTTSYPKNTTDNEPEVTCLCSAAHPCATFECIFRRGAFVHNQREHEARPCTTEHPRTVSAHHNEH